MATDFNLDPESLHRCGDCQKIFRGSQVHPIIGDLGARLEPGGIVPSGECTNCGALVYPYGDQEKYAESKGVACPFCNSKNIMAHTIDSENVEEGLFEQSVECHDCGRIWIDTYKLIGFRIEQPEKPKDERELLLDELLALTEPVFKKMPKKKREEWQRISARAADLQDGEDV